MIPEGYELVESNARRIAEGYAVPGAIGHVNILSCAYLKLLTEQDELREALREFFVNIENCNNLSDVYDKLDARFPGWQAPVEAEAPERGERR